MNTYGEKSEQREDCEDSASGHREAAFKSGRSLNVKSPFTAARK
jgi:hypothetical protein